jgi:acetoin:2,6-dichlorophenolindophenol oxidoreductase subunit beta
VTEIAYRAAVRDALAECMAQDESVVLMGEDVSLGGVFNVTPGLHERFGSDRVIDTPISELAFTAAAFGAAVRGLRPVIEIMFGDFLALALDSLANQASKYWFVSDGQASVPLTVRTAVGSGVRFGAFHSQTPTGWFLGLPGLKVVAPSSPADVLALTAAAVRDPNPVVVFEHKALYSIKGEDTEPGADAVIGRSRLVREGTDLTIVAAMATVRDACAAVDRLVEEGISAAVLDLRSLRPLDHEGIARAVSVSGRLVVVEEGPPMGGYSAEVVAIAAEQCELRAVRRVTGPDLPVPFSAGLEDAGLPNVERIVGAAREVCGDVQLVAGTIPGVQQRSGL